MCLQPGLDRFGGTIWQQVNDSMPIQVHQNGPVALSFAPSPIIDAKVMDWMAGGAFVESLHDSKNSIRADGAKLFKHLQVTGVSPDRRPAQLQQHPNSRRVTGSRDMGERMQDCEESWRPAVGGP